MKSRENIQRAIAPKAVTTSIRRRSTRKMWNFSKKKATPVKKKSMEDIMRSTVTPR